MFWTAHVLVTDVAMNYVDTVSVTIVQFATVSFISTIVSFILEYETWSILKLVFCLKWIISVSLTEGFGFFLSAIGQRYSPPSHVAFIFSLESVFTSIGGYIFLNEILSTRDFIGCILLLFATFLSQISFKEHDNMTNSIHGGGDYKEENEMKSSISITNSIISSSSSSLSISSPESSLTAVKRKKTDSYSALATKIDNEDIF